MTAKGTKDSKLQPLHTELQQSRLVHCADMSLKPAKGTSPFPERIIAVLAALPSSFYPFPVPFLAPCYAEPQPVLRGTAQCLGRDSHVPAFNTGVHCLAMLDPSSYADPRQSYDVFSIMQKVSGQSWE